MTYSVTLGTRFKNPAAVAGRIHDDKHLARIRRLPCLICNHHAPSEAAHIRMTDLQYGAEHVGMAMKPHDFLTLPLCDKHHRTGRRAEHRVGTREFWRLVGINPLPVALKLYEAKSQELRMSILLELYMSGKVRDPNAI